MKLSNPLKKVSQTGKAQTTQAEPLLDGLDRIKALIQPMRERMQRYDQAILALAQARDRMIDLKVPQPPVMRLTVERELLLARGDSEGLARFDAEHGQALQDERNASERLQRERIEQPARIKALEQVAKEIATEMKDHMKDLFDAQQVAKDVFKPYAQACYDTAQAYVQAMQAAQAADHVLDAVTTFHWYDMFGDLKQFVKPELLSSRGDKVLPTDLPGIEFEAIRDLNHAVDRADSALYDQMRLEAEAAGLDSKPVRFYTPPGEHDERAVYTPDGLVPRRVKQMPIPVGGGFTVVSI